MGGLELLGLLGGALTRLFGWFTEYKQKEQDNAHEIVLIDKQIELSKVQHVQKLEEINVQSNANIDAEWAKSLSVALEPTRTGIPLVDALNALVRPIMAFWWCLVLYTIAKGILIYVAVTSGSSLIVIADTVITDFDKAVIGSILGFFFVDRQLRKFAGK